MNRIFVLMVAKNEADRFLHQAIANVAPHVAEVFVFDDQSSDGTPQVARDAGARVVVRGPEVPSFLEHEGKFRQAALDDMAAGCQMEEGDWVLILDSDEIMVCAHTLSQGLQAATVLAESDGYMAVRIPIPTVWGDGSSETLTAPQVRVDGFWGDLAEPRLWRWRPDALFLNKPMGCRNEPTYVWQNPILDAPSGLAIMHYGYAWPEDQKERFNRYMSLRDHGHNPTFIASIRTNPKLRAWDGPWIPVTRRNLCV